MDRMLYIGMNGADQIVKAQTVNANNLANVSTTAFRADLDALRSVSVYGTGYASRAYSETFQTGIDLSAGTVMTTGRTLDIALSEKGYLAVLAKDGKDAYTRAGNLRINANGQLETGSGHLVLGNNGPIAVPPYQKLEIGVDGTITIQPQGQGVAALSVVDRLRLVSPDEAKLNKNVQGLLVLPDTEAAPAPDAKVRITTGALETSNVNAVEAMIIMIDLARQYEMNVKVMKSAETNEGALAQLLRVG